MAKFEMTPHAIQRWMQRISDTTTPDRIPCILKRSWQTKPVQVLAVHKGREICQVGGMILVVFRTNAKVVVVTVLGRQGDVANVRRAYDEDQTERMKWERSQRHHSGRPSLRMDRLLLRSTGG